jgi:hypothetical protein
LTPVFQIHDILGGIDFDDFRIKLNVDSIPAEPFRRSCNQFGMILDEIANIIRRRTGCVRNKFSLLQNGDIQRRIISFGFCRRGSAPCPSTDDD